MSQTLNKLQHIIFMQHLFCINRAYLVTNQKLKMLCHAIFFAASSYFCYCLFRGFFLDTYTVKSGYMQYIKRFQLILASEVVYISLLSRFRVNTFDAFERLNDKCSIYGDELEIGTNAQVLVSIVSTLLDVIGMVLMGLPGSSIYVLSTAFAAHDSECLLYSMLISILNKRLESLSTISFQGKTRVYKYTLLAASHFNEEYKFRISVVVFLTMLSCLIYSGVIFMTYEFATTTLLIYLVWRETKVLYTLWLLCSAAYKSEIISKYLIYDLAKQVAIEKDSNDPRHDITERWFTSVKMLQPRYGNGAVGMSTPLIILDLTFNYLLIIMQIHAEFISNKA